MSFQYNDAIAKARKLNEYAAEIERYMNDIRILEDSVRDNWRESRASQIDDLFREICGEITAASGELTGIASDIERTAGEIQNEEIEAKRAAEREAAARAEAQRQAEETQRQAAEAEKKAAAANAEAERQAAENKSADAAGAVVGGLMAWLNKRSKRK